MSLRFILVVIFLLSILHLHSQSMFCANIEKYDKVTKLQSSHSALITVNQSLLESITWLDGTKVDTTFFGTTVFYGATSTFNDPEGILFRITQQSKNNKCFENLKSHQCKAILKNSTLCISKTNIENKFCWRH